VAFELLQNLRTWARATGGTIIAALLQPTPEVYGLFDDVVLLRDGCEVFHGPRTALPAYLTDAGWTISPGVDVADWAVDWLTDPAKVLGRQLHAKRQTAAGGDAVASKQPAINTRDMVSAWKGHPLFAVQRGGTVTVGDATAPSTIALASDFARAQYGRRFVRTLASYTRSIFTRQTRLVLRNHILLITLPLANVVTALIMGSLFYKMGRDEVANKAGCIFYILTHLGVLAHVEVG